MQCRSSSHELEAHSLLHTAAKSLLILYDISRGHIFQLWGTIVLVNKNNVYSGLLYFMKNWQLAKSELATCHAKLALTSKTLLKSRRALKEDHQLWALVEMWQTKVVTLDNSPAPLVSKNGKHHSEQSVYFKTEQYLPGQRYHRVQVQRE